MSTDHPIITEAQHRWRARFGDLSGWKETADNWAIYDVAQDWSLELMQDRLMALDELPDFPEDDFVVDFLENEPIPFLPSSPAVIGVAGRDIQAGELISLGLDGKVHPATPDVLTYGMVAVPMHRKTIDFTNDVMGPIDNGEGEPVFMTRRAKQSLIIVLVCMLIMAVGLILIAIV